MVVHVGRVMSEYVRNSIEITVIIIFQLDHGNNCICI